MQIVDKLRYKYSSRARKSRLETQNARIRMQQERQSLVLGFVDQMLSRLYQEIDQVAKSGLDRVQMKQAFDKKQLNESNHELFRELATKKLKQAGYQVRFFHEPQDICESSIEVTWY